MKLKEPNFQSSQLAHVDRLITLLTDQPMSLTGDFIGSAATDAENAVTSAADAVANAATTSGTTNNLNYTRRGVAQLVCSILQDDIVNIGDNRYATQFATIGTSSNTTATSALIAAANAVETVATAAGGPINLMMRVGPQLNIKAATNGLSLTQLINIRKEALN